MPRSTPGRSVQILDPSLFLCDKHLTTSALSANVVCMAKTYTSDEVLKAIKKRMEGSSIREAAEGYGISAAYLHDILRGKRAISKNAAEKFGFEQIVKKEVVFKEVK